MTIDELAARLDQQFAKIDVKFAGIDEKFASVDEKLNASRVRDEELRELTKFGLEAREILRDEMHRRFDETDRKNDEQISLLKDTVRHLRSHK